MGQRGGDEVMAAPAAPASPPLPRAPLVVLALGLALLLALAVVPRPVLDSEQAGALLLSRSLASDGDRLWQVADRARAEGMASRGELGSSAVVGEEEYGMPFGAPLAYGLFLAPWAALAGARGALLAQGVLLAAATLFAAITLARQVGRDAAWLPAMLLFASAAGAYALRLWPEAALAAALLLAFALARGAHPVLPVQLEDELPDLYPDLTQQPPRSARFALRWLAVGALLGAVASAAPWTLPLLWPAAAMVPAPRRRRGVTLVLLAAAGVLLALALVSAATSGAPPSPRALLAALGWGDGPAALHPHVLGWDLLHLLAGRHLGLVFYFAPLLLLVALGGRGEGRGALWGGALLSLLLILLWRPFDLAGAPLAIGLRPLVLLGAALCLSPVRPPARWALALTCAWSAVWLWPLWKAPREPFAADGAARYAAPYMAPWAPLETTQTRLDFGSRLAFGNNRLVLLGGEAIAGGDVAKVPTGGWVELLAGIPGGAPGFWIDAGEEVGVELPLHGGEVTETILRPDGGIGFLVRPTSVYTRHGMPGSTRLWSFYHLSVRFPGPPGKRFTVRMRPG